MNYKFHKHSALALRLSKKPTAIATLAFMLAFANIMLSYFSTKKYGSLKNDLAIEMTKFDVMKDITSNAESDAMVEVAKEALRFSEESSSIGSNTTTIPIIGRSISPATKMGFVHIGKTGGSTLCVRMVNVCHSFIPKPCPNKYLFDDVNATTHNDTHTYNAYTSMYKYKYNETAISKAVVAYYHVPDFQKLPNAPYSDYLVTVRDVYDRTVSAFLYMHPENARVHGQTPLSMKNMRKSLEAYKCFPDLETFAGFLRNKLSERDCDYPYQPGDIVNENCAELACAALHGRCRQFKHLFFNYRNILAKLFPTDITSQQQRQQQQRKRQRRIYVIRNEHLWEDWWQINRLLGHTEDEIQTLQDQELRLQTQKQLRNTTGLGLPVTKRVSLEGQRILCEALEGEYVAYFRILGLAQNTMKNDIVHAKAIASNKCPNLDFDPIISRAIPQ